MSTPAIAHFGTTIIESAPPPGFDQKDVPRDGVLGQTLAFLEILGFEPGVENYYEGVGRQFIWRRGQHNDPDYLEQDNFTSYVAEQRPDAGSPRVGDTIFRLTHRNPQEVLGELSHRSLVTPLDSSHMQAFLACERDWLLIKAPNQQIYELGVTQAAAADNHVIYVWTEFSRVAAAAANYTEHFGVTAADHRPFHQLADVLPLRREQPGLTIGLLHAEHAALAPRWTDDIFKEAGYSHFRLGALSKEKTEQSTRAAFPGAGDVAFVYFEDSYLELVQA